VERKKRKKRKRKKKKKEKRKKLHFWRRRSKIKSNVRGGEKEKGEK
jgi:hypothetical protein